MENQDGNIHIVTNALIYDSAHGCLVIQFNNLNIAEWNEILNKAKELRNIELRAFVRDGDKTVFKYIQGELYGDGQHKLP